MADRPVIQRLLLWEERRPSLKDLVDLSADQWEAFVSFVGQFGFNPDLTESLDLATGLRLSHERTLDLLRYASFLDDQLREFGFSHKDLISEINTYYHEKHPAETYTLDQKLRTIEPFLSRLFRVDPVAGLAVKARRVTRGLVPYARAFESLCDLRPVFNEQRDQIMDYVPVAIVRVRVHNDLDHQESGLLFQIDSATLRDMEVFLQRLRKKFDAISSLATALVDEEG